MRQGWAQSLDGEQQVSDSAPITRAGPFESTFPDPSAQNSQHLWKAFRLCSRDTLSNHWHFLLLLRHPKGMPDGASVKWRTAHTLNPLASTLGATWSPLPRTLPYSRDTFWRAQWLSVFSHIFFQPCLPWIRHEVMRCQCKTLGGMDTERHLLLWSLPTVRQTPAGGSAPLTIRTCLELSDVHGFSSHGWAICFLPQSLQDETMALLISGVMLCSLQGFHEN